MCEVIYGLFTLARCAIHGPLIHIRFGDHSSNVDRKAKGLSMNASRLFRYMRRLARAYPNLAVALVYSPRGLEIGVLNILVQPDDWYQEPIKVANLEIPTLKDPAWTARIPRVEKVR